MSYSYSLHVPSPPKHTEDLTSDDRSCVDGDNSHSRSSSDESSFSIIERDPEGVLADSIAYVEDLNYGFEGKRNSTISPHLLGVFQRQEKRWESLLSSQKWTSKTKQVRRCVRKGIPPRLRARMWYELSGLAAIAIEEPSNEIYFSSMLSLMQDPFSGISIDRKVLAEIVKDVDRTYVDHPYFETAIGRENLINILSVLCIRSPHIGYCQGMNFLCGISLLHFPTQPDRAALIYLYLMEQVLPTDYFDQDLFGSHVDALVLSYLIEERMPKLSKHFKSIGLGIESMTYTWFLTVFTATLPFRVCLRIFDVLFLEGDNKILFRVGLSLLSLYRNRILEEGDFAGVWSVLTSCTSSVEDEHNLMKKAFSFRRLKRNKIEKLREKARFVVRKRLDVQQERKARHSKHVLGP